MSRGKKKRPPLPPQEQAAHKSDSPEEAGEPAARPHGKGLRGLISRPKSRTVSMVEHVGIVVVALGLAVVIQAVLIKPYQIPSGSMEPTLDIGQRILVNRFVYDFTDPAIGDIIVFHPPAGADNGTECGVPHPYRQACPRPTAARSSQNFVKRIVAGPGDKVSIRNGHPVVNDVEKTDEPYINSCGSAGACNLPKPIVVPPDYYFMMGDNRGSSDDSRFWGPIPRKWIIGKAFATYWPLDRLGLF